MENNTIKEPSPWLSLVPILVLMGLLFMTIRIFGSGALGGGSQIVLLTAAAVCCLLAIVCCKVKWASIEAAITKNVAGITPALFILLLIGALSGSWMISGVVPTLIYYGLQIIHPDFYLVSACVICAVVSLVTGSSWTTIATIGIALMGIGQAQGFSTGWIAGAIISGAYFGDKMSPLSDTTILASSTTDTPLFTHVRYMCITTAPSMFITLVIFMVAGFMYDATA
ncbi:MAG: sodium:proton antiporter, partial [Prevotellaceae bacterium]|nr:sodium:proton antiporter [Prevotellaceae bacterium]